MVKHVFPVNGLCLETKQMWLKSHEMVTLSQTEIVFSATNILSAILFHEIRLTDKML